MIYDKLLMFLQNYLSNLKTFLFSFSCQLNSSLMIPILRHVYSSVKAAGSTSVREVPIEKQRKLPITAPSGIGCFPIKLALICPHGLDK